MDDAEHDVLAYLTFPEQHRVKLHSTNPLERLERFPHLLNRGRFPWR
jgi:putative transposase